MNGSYAAGTVVPPGGMYVRALYNYDADDQTSLSFRQGDVIQVITQLESGWWDGVINGVRGWFPSNYCAVVPRAAVQDGQDGVGGAVQGADETDDEADIREEIDNEEYEAAEREAGFGNGDLGHDITPGGPQDEEAAFWIPQAMPDGRLFYFNTLTGQSSLELPLETPTSGTETGPKDRSNVNIPDHVRPELTSGTYDKGYESGYDQSASEAEGQPDHKQRELNGVSPATSNDSLNKPAKPVTSAARSTSKAQDTSMTSFTGGTFGGAPLPLMSRKFFDDVQPVAMTWDRLVDDMRRSVERYRQAIQAGDKSDFVRRVEDISDHLRLLFAAGSGTTDNHSGNPSIINSNRSLYPHFRETMSRFSKLVLSSHIASTDWPPPDSFAKCLRESEGVLNGMYGFVEVARQQRGEDIPRVIPGFVANSYTGGSWQNNGVAVQDSPMPPSLTDMEDHEPLVEPIKRLDGKMLQKLEDSKTLITASLRDLESHLHIRDKLITPLKHRAIADAICRSARVVLDRYAPWIQSVESVNLAALSSGFPSAQLQEFAVAKQTVYDSVSDLVLACQAVAAPLGDEWSETRSDSLEDRVNLVKVLSQNLEHCTSQVYYSLQLLSESVPAGEVQIAPGRNGVNDHGRTKSTASGKTLASDSQLSSDAGPSNYQNGDGDKTRSTFGEMPLSSPLSEEVPEFLMLDHEAELSYDTKVTPAPLRGGTLAALVEQLTRHDRLDSDFNNTFLLTYQSFTTGQELFEMLVHRWKIQPRQSLSQEEYQMWQDKKQKPIRFRVVNILKSWFDSYWMEGDSEEAKGLIQQVHNFAREHVAITNTPGAAPLLQAIDQRARAPGQDSARKQLVLTLNTSTPQPIMPKNMKKMKFLDIDETEFARQLTIIESKLYGKIRPTECLGKTWQKKVLPDQPEPAKNVRDLILHSNQLTNWVAQMILAQPYAKNRVVVIKRFVNVAERCRQLNNFSTLTSIISALGTAPIHRLTRTWSGVNSKTMATLESMRKLMGSTKNFLEYRDTLAKANPPCIPFFGVYLTDLTFIEDGIPSIIKKTNLINFAKRAKTAEVIRGIQQYQNVPYSLQPVPELQDYILNNMRSAGDVHEMYEMSLHVEPREREDEKIARLVDLGLL